MNYDKLESKPAHEFWNEAKNELGYSWMDVYVEEYGDSTELWCVVPYTYRRASWPALDDDMRAAT